MKRRFKTSPPKENIAFYLAIFLTLVVPVLGGEGSIFNPLLYSFLVPFFVFSAFLLVSLRRLIPQSKLYIPLASFAFFSVLSFAWSIDRSASLFEIIRILASLSIFPVVLSVRGEKQRYILLALTLSSGFIALYGIGEYLKARFLMGDPTWRIFSTFVNPNILAGFLAGSILSTSSLLLVSSEGNLLMGFLVLAQLIALILTGSRGGMLALLGGAVFFLIVVIRTGYLGVFLKRLVPILAIAGLLFVVGGFLRPMERRVAERATETHSSAFRVLLWRSSIRMIQARPWGWGAGTFEYVYPRFALGGFSKNAHNSYLQFGCELGIQGVLSLLAFLFLLATYIHKRHPSFPPERSALAGACLAGIFASSLHSLIDYDWQVLANFSLLLLLSASAVSLLSHSEARLGRRLFLLPLFLLILCLWQGIGDYLVQTGKGLLGREPWRAKACLRIALYLHPWDGESMWYLGQALFASGKEEGLTYMRRSLSLHPYPPNFYKLGNIYLRLGKEKEAEYWYRKALEVDPHSLPSYIALGKLLLKAGRREEARVLFLKVLEIKESPYEKVKPVAFMKEPAYPIAELELAKMMLKEGKKEEALRLLEEAKREFEDYLAIWKEWREVMEPFTYVEAEEVRMHLQETKSLLRTLR